MLPAHLSISCDVTYVGRHGASSGDRLQAALPKTTTQHPTKRRYSTQPSLGRPAASSIIRNPKVIIITDLRSLYLLDR